MAAYKSWGLLLLCLFLASLSLAQDAQQSTKPASSGPNKVPLELISSTPVKSLPSQGLGLPIPCGPDNTIVARFAPIAPLGGGVSDPVTIGSDGNVVGRFGREKISDVQKPAPLTIFPRDNKVFILTRGEVPLGYQSNLKRPSGEVVQRPAIKTQYFITRFTKDGNYLGALALDVPFKPIQVGVFESGDFLLAGEDVATGNPRIGIADSRGQFLRPLELSGDVRARSDSDQDSQSPNSLTLPRYGRDLEFGTSLAETLLTSQMVANGPDLILFRPVGSLVFSVSPGGVVRVVKLKVPGKLQIFAVKPTQNAWFVEFMHEENKAELFDIYSFNPETGEPETQYSFPNDMGFGLACVDDGGKEFTFVMGAEDGNGLKLLKLAPKTR